MSTFFRSLRDKYALVTGEGMPWRTVAISEEYQLVSAIGVDTESECSVSCKGVDEQGSR